MAVQMREFCSIAKRKWCKVCLELPLQTVNKKIIQFRDFENIEWDRVMAGEHIASSYLIRKGLSRKAQMSMQLKRYFSKHKSTYSTCFPTTVIIDTWNASDDIKVDFGLGVSTTFECANFSNVPFRTRLEWALDDANEEFCRPERADWTWILKPSVTNKGANMSLVKSWDSLLNALEATPDIREWVLQRYIAQPLLINGHKFHLRVYVLCVGALRVYTFERILILLAGHSYNSQDLNDIYCHLTNTARSAELEHFSEEKYIKLLDDLPEILVSEQPDLAPSLDKANDLVNQIHRDIHGITNQLFSAYENEYTVFAPLSNCFELYGLDFLVDDDLKVHFLEANPGPDFKQTGDRLKRVIEDLFDQTCAIVVDMPHAKSYIGNDTVDDDMVAVIDNPHSMPSHTSLHREKSSKSNSHSNIDNNDNKNENIGNNRIHHRFGAKDFTLVYDKEWSAARINGGFSFIE